MKYFKEKAELIWKVADLIRGEYKQSDYGRVILPMTVIRRLHRLFESTKQTVLDFLLTVENLSDSAKDITFYKIVGYNFHNRGQFSFEKLFSDPNKIAVSLRNYIKGFSIMPNDFFAYWRVTVEQPVKEEGKIVKSKGKPKPNASLRDYENIPFLKKLPDSKLLPQTIEDYFKAEVLPHLPDAWIDHDKTKIGYEINFTKYFYEFKPLRALADIRAEIMALEHKTLEVEKTIIES